MKPPIRQASRKSRFSIISNPNTHRRYQVSGEGPHHDPVAGEERAHSPEDARDQSHDQPGEPDVTHAVSYELPLRDGMDGSDLEPREAAPTSGAASNLGSG